MGKINNKKVALVLDDIIPRLRYNFEVIELAKQFPEQAEELIDRILKDPKLSNLLITDCMDLLATAEQFPHRKKELMDFVFNNPKLLYNLINDGNKISRIEEKFPDQASEFLRQGRKMELEDIKTQIGSKNLKLFKESQDSSNVSICSSDYRLNQ